MITTLFWDIDDTLLDFHRAEDSAIRKTFAQIGLPADDETVRLYCQINESMWKQLERGCLTREDVLVGRFETLFERLDVHYSAQMAQDMYFSYLGQEHEYINGAEEVLVALHGRYRMMAVSNGTVSIQQKRMAASGVDRYFEQIFLSEVIGAEKPGRAFFDACFAALPDVSREEVLIIGDSLTSDMRGGEDAGLHTCWFNPHGKVNTVGVRIDHEITALSQILPLLRTIG